MTAPATPARKPISDPVQLEVPIVRGEQTITSLQLRRPLGGDLRGLNLKSVIDLDIDQLRKLLPRISVPTILPQDAEELDPADLLQLAVEVADFFTPSALKPDSPQRSMP